jgi:hypothetical protein
MSAASSLRIWSSEFRVVSWVLVLYGAVASTRVIRSWSKKIWPTCEEWVVELLPRRVPLVRMVVSLALWART